MRERKDMAGRLAQATDGVTQAGWREIVSILLLRLVVVICFVVVLAFLLPGDRIACYAFIRGAEEGVAGDVRQREDHAERPNPP